jgi:hypothetical protein
MLKTCKSFLSVPVRELAHNNGGKTTKRGKKRDNRRTKGDGRTDTKISGKFPHGESEIDSGDKINQG